jgi:hypothetical protein
MLCQSLPVALPFLGHRSATLSWIATSNLFFLLLGYAEQPQDGQGPHQAGEPAEGEAKQPERLRRRGRTHQVCKIASVADPGSDFFPSRIRIFSIPDPKAPKNGL